LCSFNGALLKTLGERIKFIQKQSGLNQADFSKSLGISKGSLNLYQKNKRRPDSSLLKSFCELYGVDPSWLLLGLGEPFELEGRGIISPQDIMPPLDPVEQLLAEEEARANLSLTPEQRAAILKILRELISRDIRSIRELLQAIPGGQTQGQD
jgi:transcriptional regulator with XRE-family HTH domain